MSSAGSAATPTLTTFSGTLNSSHITFLRAAAKATDATRPITACGCAHAAASIPSHVVMTVSPAAAADAPSSSVSAGVGSGVSSGASGSASSASAGGGGAPLPPLVGAASAGAALCELASAARSIASVSIASRGRPAAAIAATSAAVRGKPLRT